MMFSLFSKTQAAALSLVLLGVAAQAEMTPPIVARPFPPRVPPAPIGKVMKPIKIDASKIETIRKGPAVNFAPFALKDPSTGNGSEQNAKPISPNTILTLPGGKQVTAGAYFSQLNQFEQNITQFGYTLRDKELKTVELHRAKFNVPVMRRQAQVEKANHRPDQVRIKLPLNRLKDLHVAKMGQIDKIKGSIIAAGQGKPAKTYSANRNWSASWGSDDSFSTYITANIDLSANQHVTKADAQGAAGGAMFGQKLDVVRATTSYVAPTTGNLTGNTTLYFLGRSIYSKDHNSTSDLFFGDEWSQTLDANTSIEFTIGPIPMSATLGAQGNATLDFRMDLLPIHANADITPSLGSKVYAQVGVDIVVGGAGAGGDLVLLNASVPVIGRMQIQTDAQGPYYLADISVDDTLQALAGRLYVYAWLEVPRWGLPPWEKKEWDWTLWNFDGIQANGNILSYQNRLNVF
jgi:hypothetical protein